MVRWHNGLLPKRNTWRRLGRAIWRMEAQNVFFFEYPQNPLVYLFHHGLFNAKLLVKLWCRPPIPRQKTGRSAGGFSADPAPVGLFQRSPLRPLWPWLLDDMWTRSCFFPPRSGHWFGFFLWNFFGSWRLLMIFSRTYGEYQIWGVSGKLFRFWSLSQCCFFAIDWRIWLIWPVLGDSNNDKPMVAIPSNIDFHHFDPLNDTTHLPGITLSQHWSGG